VINVADDILACFLEEALEVVEKAGICNNIEVQYTVSPKSDSEGKGQERVVRFLLYKDTGLITVIREV